MTIEELDAWEDTDPFCRQLCHKIMEMPAEAQIRLAAWGVRHGNADLEEQLRFYHKYYSSRPDYRFTGAARDAYGRLTAQTKNTPFLWHISRFYNGNIYLFWENLAKAVSEVTT